MIKNGQIVPVAITCGLLKTAMEKAGWEKLFLIDGFPRNKDNLDGWNSVMGDKVDFKCVLHFDVSEEEMCNRIMERGKTSGRNDDNRESLLKRLENFKQEQFPIISYFTENNQCQKINAA